MKFNGRSFVKLSLLTAFILSSQSYAKEENKVEKSSKSLGSVEVVSSTNSENTKSYTTDKMRTSSKLNLSIRNTPQSVSILTTQQMKDQNITSFQDLMENVSGVTINRWDERIYPYARGFKIDYYKVDGMPSHATIADNDFDLAMFDRVEVVKGANGLTTGAGNPALSLNFVRKHATSKDFKGNISLSGGSWDRYSATADISTPLNSEGSVRARIVAKHEDKKSFMDKYQKKNDFFYGVVDMDLTDTTFLSLGASYQKLDRDGIRWGGLPAFYTNGSRTHFDKSDTVTEDWTYWNSKTKNYFVDLKQFLYEDITFNLSYSHKKIYSDTALLYFGGRVDKATNMGVEYTPLAYTNKQYDRENNIDAYISAPFTLAGLDHEIILGYMYNKKQTVYNDSGYPSLAGSSLNFNHINIQKPEFDYSNEAATNKTVQTGMYLVGKFSLLDTLKLVAGARLSDWEYESADGVGNREFNNEVTPYVGIVYDINDNHSIYASYTEIFNPQDKKTVSGSYLDPVEGKNYEVGIKGEYFDGKLNASLSIFRIEQDNVAQSDGGKKVIGSTDNAYKAAEGVTSKGFEIELAGEITDNWNINFGLANFEAKDANGDKFATNASRTTANLFTKYKLKDLSFGAGVNYNSKQSNKTIYGTIKQSSTVTANAMANYKISKNLNLQLNVNNIFDKRYYSGIGENGSKNSMVYADPRNATLTLQYSF
ncbi:TonB-dependent siderophore receptor [Malaciobacter molluscorum LMG 25693]|uniref:TonB-dependent ferric coprogen/ferric-rhodotorulic acid receptor n=1 Tax=Malaciobacter molluscorum LMG 25693 TaxID=870501 RepID=A0A2G1DKK5_9BACT|nr:TonB-dependent siderophore receptor [Malaciobacter molluscorum]AXX91405.1 TonB-dependent ferric coprogen/ferric-rhodotorulic acid receptor [Malaciobacter molluscorum LMG 25693]PHO18846.1 TonB-dependent siderophore receptor [Malaciobacter molluscorum LMG 25693]